MRSHLCQVILAKFTNTNIFALKGEMFLFAKKMKEKNCNRYNIYQHAEYLKIWLFIVIFITVINLTYWVDFHLKPRSADIAEPSEAVADIDVALSGLRLVRCSPALASDWLVAACGPWLGDPSVSISHSTNTLSVTGPRLHQQCGEQQPLIRGRAEYYTFIWNNN